MIKSTLILALTMAASETQSSSHASSSDHTCGIVATLGLANHSPFICEEQYYSSVGFILNGTIHHKNMQKMAQAMLPLMKFPCPLTAVEEDLIG